MQRRQQLLEVRERETQRTPTWGFCTRTRDDRVSKLKSRWSLQVPTQQASWRARGKAFRNCNWTWRRFQSTAGSSFGGKWLRPSWLSSPGSVMKIGWVDLMTSWAKQKCTDLDIDFVSTENDRDVLAHALQIPMPVWNVFVSDPRRNIKHDDSTLALDIISVTETTKLLLAGRVPHVEADRTKVGKELQWVDFNTKGG